MTVASRRREQYANETAARASTAQGAGMGLVGVVTIFLFGAGVQLALETTAELTAETLADSDIGIVPGPAPVAAGDIIDIAPAAMPTLPP